MIHGTAGTVSRFLMGKGVKKMGQYYYVPGPGEQTNGFQPTMPDRMGQPRPNQNPGPIMPPMPSIQPMQPMPVLQQPQPVTNGIIWVQGEAGAKAYLTVPGASVLLMDSENNTFYIKSSDQSGMPLLLRIFDYTERTAVGGNAVQKSEQQQAEQTDFSNFHYLFSADCKLKTAFSAGL